MATTLEILRQTAFVDLLRHPNASQNSVFVLRDKGGKPVAAIPAAMNSTPWSSPENLARAIASACGHWPHGRMTLDVTAQECRRWTTADPEFSTWRVITQSDVTRYRDRYTYSYVERKWTFVV